MLVRIIAPVGAEGPVETPGSVFELVHRICKLDLGSPNLFYGLFCVSLAGNDA